MPKITTHASAEVVGETLTIKLDAQEFKVSARSNAELLEVVRVLRGSPDPLLKRLAEKLAFSVVNSTRRHVFAKMFDEGASLELLTSFGPTRHLLNDDTLLDLSPEKGPLS